MKKRSNSLTYTDITLIKLAAAIIMCICTSLTLGKNGTWGNIEKIHLGTLEIPMIFLPLKSLFQMPEVIVYMIFGLLHSFIATEQIKQKTSSIPTINFFTNWILCASFYKLILLPSCGFGYIEWTILGLMFACEFGVVAQSKKLQKPNWNDKTIIVFGILLLLLKIIIRYMLPVNLSENLLGNSTVLNMIAIMVGLLAIYGLKSVISALKLTKGTRDATNLAVGVGTKTGKTVAKIGSSLIKTAASLITTVVTSGPILLIIIGVILAGGITTIILVGHKVTGVISNIRTDIINLIAPILQETLQADNAAYADDILNTIGMIVAFAIFMGVNFFQSGVWESIEKEEAEQRKEIEHKEQKEKTLLDIYSENSKLKLNSKTEKQSAIGFSETQNINMKQALISEGESK